MQMNYWISLPTLECKGKLHDTIINFGDDLAEDVLQRAQDHAKQCDLMLALGSTISVTPASELVGARRGGRVVIVNRQHTEKVRRGWK